jgi:hypothetical protein
MIIGLKIKCGSDRISQYLAALVKAGFDNPEKKDFIAV